MFQKGTDSSIIGTDIKKGKSNHEHSYPIHLPRTWGSNKLEGSACTCTASLRYGYKCSFDSPHGSNRPQYRHQSPGHGQSRYHRSELPYYLTFGDCRQCAFSAPCRSHRYAFGKDSSSAGRGKSLPHRGKHPQRGKHHHRGNSVP